jgi:hypothetical protein
VISSSLPSGGAAKRWQQVLGGRTASPLAGANTLSAMSKLDAPVPAPRTAPVSMPDASVSPSRAADSATNPYFPATGRDGSPLRAAPIPIPGKGDMTPVQKGKIEPLQTTGLTPPPPTVAPTPPSRQEGRAETPLEPDDGLVNVPIQWVGGGKNVYVTGNFAENWKGRIKLRRR